MSTLMIFAVAIFGPYLLVCLIITVVQSYQAFTAWVRSRREERIATIEAELDRTQAELRRTILDLSAALGAEAHEARKALIRESFIARGEIPRD